MARLNSRAKGRRYELHIGRLLREWWGGTPDDFRPAPLSGGWSKRDAPYDLVVPAGFPLGPECKRRDTEWTWGSFLAGTRKAGPAEWMEQARSACLPGAIPAVFFSRNREPDWVALELGDARRFQDAFGLAPAITRHALGVFLLEDALEYWDADALRGGGV